MPSRQGRLDSSYFSQGSGSSPARKRQQKQKAKGRYARLDTDSDDDDDDLGGADSEGSAGINAIRLSESPAKNSADKPRQATRAASDDSDDVLLLTPNQREKVKAKNEQAQEKDEEGDAVGNFTEAGPSGTAQEDAEPADAPEIIAIDVDDDDDAPVALPQVLAPKTRRRVSLATPGQSSSSSSSGPQPKIYTRVRASARNVSPVTVSTSTSASKRSIPYIELASFTDKEKAQYKVLSSVNPASAPRKSTATGSGRSAPRAATKLADVVEVSDDEPEERPRASASTSKAPPAKRARSQAIELPSSKRRVELASKQPSRTATSTSRAVQPTKTTEAHSSRPNKNAPVFDGIESADDADADDVSLNSTKNKVDKGKGKGKAKAVTPPPESDDEAEEAKQRNKRKAPASKTTTTGAANDTPRKRRPDMTQRERDEMLAEIDLDEPKRFSSQTRLRKKKETPFQRHLRKMKAKKAGVIEPDTESDEDEDEDVDEESDSDSAPDSCNSEDFIEDDGGVVADGVLPHEFSLSSAQTPEWKFKVVFHYFVLIVVNGTGVLPLTGENKQYMIPQLEDLRRKMEGFREQRVRSQVWSHELVKALKRFPEYKIASLEYPEEHCVACNRRNFASTFRVHLAGEEYDRNTYEPLSVIKARNKRKNKNNKKNGKQGNNNRSSDASSDDDVDESSSSSSDSDTGKRKPKEMECLLGAHCKKRTHVFHQMVHWELELYRRVRSWYNDILRAKRKDVPDDSQESSSDPDSEEDAEERMQRKLRRDFRRDDTMRRVKRMRNGDLPDAYRDVDAIQDWMDEQGHILNELKWMEDLQEQSRRLEFDKSKDE